MPKSKKQIKKQHIKENIIVGTILGTAFLLGAVFGIEGTKYVYDPTPEQCLNVCTEMFTRMGC